MTQRTKKPDLPPDEWNRQLDELANNLDVAEANLRAYIEQEGE